MKALPEIVALEFAQALAKKNYKQAHGLLSKTLQAKFSEEWLEREYHAMIAESGATPETIEIMQTLDVWPDKEKNDLVWVYIAIAGEDFSEAITVVVELEEEALKLRSIEWGHP